ncbi:hypothetical protein DPEC_G00220470 [Dallia pectoralis]|uniref:Uncharacterized protein n=1 Tax=Dallia pectoralis TaxID=75939 RepID=A0ACC2G3S8_DALPE|nr:hypothetical protein DPEC_G00220470 [Dallia pectoralis]
MMVDRPEGTDPKCEVWCRRRRGWWRSGGSWKPKPCLMELERWQDDILWQLHGAGAPGTSFAAQDEELVRNYFSGVGRQVEALGKELWAVVGSGLTLARRNPIPFVSAVRIVEREETDTVVGCCAI